MDLDEIRKNGKLKNLERCLENDSDSFSVNIGIDEITGQPNINYLIVGETYFFDENKKRKNRFRAPNAEIMRRNYFTRDEKQNFTKIEPGKIEIVEILPNNLDYKVNLVFCRNPLKLEKFKEYVER